MIKHISELLPDFSDDGNNFHREEKKLPEDIFVHEDDLRQLTLPLKQESEK